MKPLNIAVIGTGNRFFSYYVDILLELKKRKLINIVGVYNRTIKKGEEASKILNCPLYNSTKDLIQKSDAVINILRGDIKHSTSLEILGFKKNLFLETPAGYNTQEVKNLLKISNKQGLVVGVAEDFAFFPEAQLQKEIIQSGLLGRVLAVFNNSASYAYHPIVRLHSLVGTLSSVVSYKCKKEKVTQNLFLAEKHLIFKSGLHYFERMASPKNHFLRQGGTWKILCEFGLLTDENVILYDSGETTSRPIKINKVKLKGSVDQSIHSLNVEIKDKKFTWLSSWPKPWTKKHTALANNLVSFIENINGKKELFYGLEKAYYDISLWRNSEIAFKLRFVHNHTLLSFFEYLIYLKKKLRS